MMQWFIFAVISTFNLIVSWKSLHHAHSHGFFRFFTWEAMLCLFLLNMKFWFHDPFSWNQIAAWSLLMLCLIPLAFGVYSLRTHGKPVSQRTGDPSLLAFEKTTTLVTSGVYRYIRHPLYSSLFLLTWGIFFKHIAWQSIILALLSTLLLLLTAKADELECLQYFGTGYADYMNHTKRFIPFVF